MKNLLTKILLVSLFLSAAMPSGAQENQPRIKTRRDFLKKVGTVAAKIGGGVVREVVGGVVGGLVRGGLAGGLAGVVAIAGESTEGVIEGVVAVGIALGAAAGAVVGIAEVANDAEK